MGYVAFMDGDGQFDPADLIALAALMPGADLVAGWRRRRADPGYRRIIAGVFNLLVRALYGVRVRDVDCGLKLMRREVLDAAAPLLARSALLNTELYFKCQRSGLQITQIAVNHYPRVAGVRSGARLIPILRAIRDLVWLRLRLARHWRAPSRAAPVPESS
jgi:glycosyltransferase involved in cell wall biosynthesis